MYKSLRNTSARALLAMAALFIAPHQAAAATYTIAVVPQFPAVEILRSWTPLLQRLGAATGNEFRLRSYPSIPEFEKDFLAGKSDFVYLNPYHMVMAAKAQHYVPLVREGEKKLSGILVVRADSPAQKLADLQGQTLAFPAPNAFGASLYARALLAENGVPFKPQYVKTHSTAYRHVLSGNAAAAGGVRASLEREPAELRQQLRVLFETPAVPAHPIAAHPRVPPGVRKAVLEAMLNLAATDEGRALLKDILMPVPAAADYRADYAPLERLNLKRFVVRDGDS